MVTEDEDSFFDKVYHEGSDAELGVAQAGLKLREHTIVVVRVGIELGIKDVHREVVWIHFE